MDQILLHVMDAVSAKGELLLARQQKGSKHSMAIMIFLSLNPGSRGSLAGIGEKLHAIVAGIADIDV